MGFAIAFRRFFSGQDWSRGRHYAQFDAVTITATSPFGVRADVRGTGYEPYRVAIDWSQHPARPVGIYCDCPRFEDVNKCKHVAALIHAIDDSGMLAAMSPPPSRVQADFELGELEHHEAPTIKPNAAHERHLRAMAKAVAARANKAAKPATPKTSPWKSQIAQIAKRQSILLEDEHVPAATGVDDLWYALDIGLSLQAHRAWIGIRSRTLKKDGSFGGTKPRRIAPNDTSKLGKEDREILGLLIGSVRDDGYSSHSFTADGNLYGSASLYTTYRGFGLSTSLYEVVLPRLCATKRFGWTDPRTNGQSFHPIAWDDGPAWKISLEVEKTKAGKHWRMYGQLQREGERRPFGDARLVFDDRFILFEDRLARYESEGVEWVEAIENKGGELLVPVAESAEFAEALATLPRSAPFELPSELRWETMVVEPVPHVSISPSRYPPLRDLNLRLSFRYDERHAPLGGGPQAWFDREQRNVVRRDWGAEQAAFERLGMLGLRPKAKFFDVEPGDFALPAARMPEVVEELLAAGWQVEAEGRTIRNPGKVTLSVSSGVDWFDLEGTCDFDGATATLPQLLAALRKGEKYVKLDDGTHGLLPAEWLNKYASLADMGESVGENVRFRPAQATLLDAMLSAQEPDRVTLDRQFKLVRDKLRRFDGVEARQEPATFRGELRPYQREGLGWLAFLDEFGFGGCLADDMGLGKTVQVLAMLDERRQRNELAPANADQTKGARRSRSRKGLSNSEQAKSGKANATSANGATAITEETGRVPSLVVAPKSLIFNWVEEAQRFAPQLKVLRYTGFERAAAFEELGEYDVVVTTYGTLRKDIEKLNKVQFDYAILDEAQAIKNASSQSAKACRLLKSKRRLAMTGTPVENHLGELWSLFEFLNPGMLGRDQKLHERFSANHKPSMGFAHAGGKAKDVETEVNAAEESDAREGVKLLSRALRPYLLRRTKAQVLTELPEKTQQTLYCDLDSTQRKLYNELRAHYRQSLLERVERDGVNRSKIQVLEALLRLRQAACHPGLLDPQKVSQGSAKLDALMEKLDEVLDEGHKALVFSQFTSLLAIVRKQLDARGVIYEYLDGKTAKRQQHVERFQTDEACKLFLISLKAGGQGLNLTAADYVFILDPWWNPAVESQAIDRAHRMGQQRPVFAYRLIARDTVEEKILKLQDQKRDLADAIVSAENSVMRSLTADDLRMLLG